LIEWVRQHMNSQTRAPDTALNGFMRIGFPAPALTAHFVGAVEIVYALLVLLGLWTRLPAISSSS
jgi:uncharacterized membrane protein YphA (DoxX/SURF4 family)